MGGGMSKFGSVLLVDDNPRCLEFLTLAFELHGMVSVSSELRPTTALDRIRTERPDLVMLDLKMPELDGFGVLEMLRGEGNPVPILICSGATLQKDVDRAYASGCNGYLEKPSTIKEYRTMVDAIVDYWRLAELPAH
jgi:DNA-binding response OmpR family regulator